MPDNNFQINHPILIKIEKMKKIFILSISLSLIAYGNIFCQTPIMQASIGPGSTPTRAVIYMKDVRPSAGPVVETISTLDFNVGLNTSDYTIPPTMSVISNSFNIPWSIEAPYSEGGFWNYHIYKAVDITYSFTANTEIPAMEIELIGGAPTAISSPLNVSLVTLTDGGSTQAAIFYCTGTIFSDGSNLYYSRPSDAGYITTATNGFSYRPVGVNSTLGNAPSTATIITGTTPVKFLGFNVTKNKNDAFITWQVENETALTDHYEIERSVNGVDFGKVATLLPKNNGSSANIYDLTDLNLTAVRTSGVIYYRVKQFDKDGKFVTSPVKSVRLDGKQLAVAVYPNPIRNYANVTLDLVDDAEVLLTITDASGKQVQNLQWQLFKGPNVRKINMANVASGSYMLKVQTGTETKVVPLVKAN